VDENAPATPLGLLLLVTRISVPVRWLPESPSGSSCMMRVSTLTARRRRPLSPATCLPIHSRRVLDAACHMPLRSTAVRIVYHINGTEVVLVLCVGARRDDEVYEAATRRA
jgi:hypothetical protein